MRRVFTISKQLFRTSRQIILRKMACLGQSASLLYELKKVIIIAPHPDDEVLGCGGLIAQLTAKGANINILFLTRGEAAHQECCKTHADQIGEQRFRLAIASNKILGVLPECLHFLDGKDGSLPHKGQDGFIELAKIIAAYIEAYAPDAVFFPHAFEGWPDHVAAEELTKRAIIMLPQRSKLYHYCVWFWHNMPIKSAWRIDWKQARLLDITKELPLKKCAMQTYQDSLAPCGHPYIGILPARFLRAFEWDKELFFEVSTMQWESNK